MDVEEFLWQHWEPLWSKTAIAQTTFDSLKRAYKEPLRHYHTLRHIAECVSDIADQPATCMRDVKLALFFHDWVYNPRASHENEERSADTIQIFHMRYGFAPPDPDTANHIARYILATRHTRGAPEVMNLSLEWDLCLVLDSDLAILGMSPARFDEYEEQIRAEYSHVPDDIFRTSRSKILEGFLTRPRIFRLPHFHTKYEKKARENIARSIAKLR